jgi:hypothetical protein
MAILMNACNKDVNELVNNRNQLIAVSQIDIGFLDSVAISSFSVCDTIRDNSVDMQGNITKTLLLETYQKEAVIAQMEKKGFIYIPINDTIKELPDLFIDITYIETQYIHTSNFGWWYEVSAPYWFKYWSDELLNPRYPACYTYLPSYTTKTLIIDCLHIKNERNNEHNASSCFFSIIQVITDKYTE